MLKRLVGEANWTIAANAGSLFGSAASSALLGYAFWWVATHLLLPEAVGFASAVIAAMTLLATLATLGLGTLSIGQLADRRTEVAAFLTTSLLMAAAVGGGLGLLFALASPWLGVEWRDLAQQPLAVLSFAVGVSLTTVALVLDQALIGLLRGGLQFWRNLVFAIVKLGLLPLAALWLGQLQGLTVLHAWVLGLIISALVLIGLVGRSGQRLRFGPFRWRLLRGIGRAAVGHHALNVALQAAPLALPILVVSLLSARVNAAFYIAWLLANGLFIVSNALTLVLYAVGASQRPAVPRTIRFTLAVGLIGGLLGIGVLAVGAEPITTWFGREVAELAAQTLRLMSLGMLPIVIKDHFVALCRIERRIGLATGLALLGSGLELALAAAGAALGGLTGLTLGWLSALVIEAALGAPLVWRTLLTPVRPSAIDTAGASRRPAIEPDHGQAGTS